MFRTGVHRAFGDGAGSAALLLAVLALSAGCRGGPAEPEHPTVTGDWTGTGVSYGAAERWRFRLEESSQGGVTGTFSLRVERLVFSGTVSGTHIYPALSLDLDMVFYGQIVAVEYEGRLSSSDAIAGTVRFFDDPARSLDLDRLGA